MKIDWLSKVQLIAKSQGGKCLSTEYTNAHTKLNFTCKNKHFFSASPATVLRGTWCKKCAHKKTHIQQKTPYEKIKSMTEKSNFVLLTEKFEYEATSTPKKYGKFRFKIKCTQNHISHKSLDSLKNRTQCNTCSYNNRNAHLRIDIKQVSKLAFDRGGKLISESYKNNNQILNWECKAGHQFTAKYNNVKNGTWCPTCSRIVSISESICLKYFSELTGITLKTAYPAWLKTPEGTQLEIDGYNEIEKIAIEHHGSQHYQVKSFGKSEHYERRIFLDKYKKNLILSKGIRFLEVRELLKETSLDDLREIIISFCKENRIPLKDNYKTISININNLYNVNPLDRYRAIAAQRSGSLLTKMYKGFKDKLEFKCSANHLFKTTPSSINQGTWCPECYKLNKPNLARKNTIELMQNVAIKKNGKCLSTKYLTNMLKLKWECSQGHIFEMNYNNVKSGKWCKLCARNKTADAQRDSIKTFQAIAKRNHGTCLSKTYTRAKEKLLFKCFKGHVFERVAYDVKKKKKWCPICLSDTQAS